MIERMMGMIPVLLVDDESLTCTFLAEKIPKLNPAFSIAGTASNGMEALEFIENNQVDLVITDIKMPVMSGLELCNEIKKRFPSVMTVILSGHGEFDYVREAIKYSVMDYMIKPIVNSELADILNTVENELAERTAMEAARNSDQQLADLASDLLVSLYLKAKARRYDQDAAFYMNRMGTLQISGPSGPMMLVKAYSGNAVAANDAYPSESLEPFICINAFCAQEYSGYSFSDLTGNVISIICNVGKQAEATFLAEYYRKLSSLWDSRWGELQLACVCTNDAENLYEALEISERLLLFRSVRPMVLHFTGQKSYLEADILFVAMEALESAEKAWKHLEVVRRIVGAGGAPVMTDGLTGVDEVTIKLRLKQAYEVISGCLDGNISFDKSKLLYSIISYAIPSMNGVDVDIETYAAHWDDEETPAQMLKLAAKQLEQANKTERPVDSNRIVRSAVEFIIEHFNRPISLTMVADTIGVSTCYLSNVFSKETGAPYSKFVTELRMHAAAQQLVGDKDMRLAEVAERTGYVSSKHFLKVFKAYFGVTPTEYRENHTEPSDFWAKGLGADMRGRYGAKWDEITARKDD